MARYIDGEHVKEILNEDVDEVDTSIREHETFFLNGLKRAIHVIDKAPTADVQPVVHCKDCKYAQNPNDTMVYCTYFECGTMSQNDFCSQGERRTENDDR